MSITGTRDDVVAEAMTWLGTPYHHHGAVKGVGVDCARILAMVYSACGLVPPIDLGNYRRDWHLHRAVEQYRDRLLEYTNKINDPDVPLRGDIALFRFGRTLSHAGIFVEDDQMTIIHPYVGRGVIISRLDEAPLVGRDVLFFTPFI